MVVDTSALIDTLNMDVVSLSLEQTDMAMDAWLRFGKGRHPAGLNIGDCCAYSLVASMGLALLYKGQDFGLTDLDCVHV